jgi:hypothetical protein
MHGQPHTVPRTNADVGSAYEMGFMAVTMNIGPLVLTNFGPPSDI